MAVQPPPLQQDQPPVVNVSAQNGVEDTPLAITGVSVTDPDAGNSDISLTLSVADGTLDVEGLAERAIEFVMRGLTKTPG